MRKLMLVLSALVAFGNAAPGWTQWLPSWTGGPSSFAPGQTYTLMFDQPGITGFESLDGPGTNNGTDPFSVTYDPSFLDSLVVVPGSLTALVEVFASGPIPAGTNPIALTIYESNPTGDGTTLPAGSLFGIQFTVKRVGGTNLNASYTLMQVDPNSQAGSLATPGSASIPIVAVPEPATWATMLAGLILIGTCVARTRRWQVARMI